MPRRCVRTTMDTVQRTLIGISLVLSATLVSCGSETSTTAADAETSPSQSASVAAPEGLTCPTNGRVSSGGGLLAEVPEGPDTAQELVDSESTEKKPWVLAGRKAYELRPDGTAFKVHDLVKGPKGWFVDGYEACG